MRGQIAIDLFYVLLGTIVVAIVAFIVRAVRLTNASIHAASGHIDLTNPDTARAFIADLRARDVRCSRCGGQTSIVLGTTNRYRCDECEFEAEGPVHMPGTGASER